MTTGNARAETLPNRATLVDIAESVGTPVYVYDAAVIRAAYRAFADSLAGHPHAIHYALKANSTLALVRLLRSLGAEADANSGGEIEVALRAGYHPGADRLHRRRQDRRRARPRRLARCEGDQRRVSRRARSDRRPRPRPRHDGARGDAREPRHRRQEPPAYLHGAEDQQVRHAARPGAGPLPRARPPAGPGAGRPAHSRRLADHLARAAAPRRRARGRAGPRAARRRHRRSSTWTWAAASAFPTTGRPSRRRERTRPPFCRS